MPASTVPDQLIPAIGYIRVSLAREEMISPELQREAILRWAKRTSHEIIDWVEDLDKTGRNFKRRIMGVIERVEAGEVRVIAVWKYSRFGRSRTGVPANLARVEKAGGDLLSATEEVDARTAIGRFQRGMIMEFNAFESDRAGEQWMETHQWRRDHGLPAMGKPRFGYTWYPRKRYEPDGRIILQEERYVPDPIPAEAIVAAYRRYVAGDSYRSIALSMNDAGHRTVRQDLWTGRALKRYLDSGFPAGYLKFHLKTCPKGAAAHECDQYELVKHPTLHHPALITEEEWRAYNERRSFTKTAAPRARQARYPLTGLVRCGVCATAAHRKVDGRKSAAYRCGARQEKGAHACPGTSLRQPVLEQAILDYLASLTSEINQSAAQHGEALPRQRQGDSGAARIAALEASVTKLDRAIARQMKAYALAEDEDADGALEAAHIATLGELRAERAGVARELSKLMGSMEELTVEAQRAAAVPVALGLLEEWDTLAPAHANALLRQVVQRVELLPSRSVRIVPVWEA